MPETDANEDEDDQEPEISYDLERGEDEDLEFD